jgi:hypothetical protein
MYQHLTPQPGGGNPWVPAPVKTSVVVKDSIVSYAGYLADSLNPGLAVKPFRFELKEIILPSDSIPSADSALTYPSLIIPEGTLTTKINTSYRKSPGFDWITLVLILGFGALAWVRHFYPRRLKSIFLSTYAKRYIGQLVRDGNIARERISPALGFVSIISYTMIVYGFAGTALSSYVTRGNTLVAFLLIAVTLLLLWLIRRLFVSLAGSIYKSRTASEIYLLNSLLFTLTSGIFLFPFAVVWFFTHEEIFLYAGVGIMLITLGMRLFRNIIGGLQVQSFSGIYIFLYFCTLEILPLAIGFKIYKILIW